MFRAGANISRHLRRSPIARGLSTGPGVIFNLPLADLGAGIVDTTPAFAAGSATATSTRATVAWTKLSSGLWAQVASGQPRSCYIGANTAVGAYGGYFCEDAGTQLVTPDASIRDMTDASWVAVNVTPAKTGTGIDGVVNSCSRLTSGAIGGTIQQTLVAAASSRTYSAWIRRVSGTGTITINQGATTSDITAQINSTTHTQVSLTASVLNAAFGITFGASGDVIEVDFNQFESGGYASSPMATAGAARSFDLLTYPYLGNVSDLAGAFYLESVVMYGSSSVIQLAAPSARNPEYLAVNLAQSTNKKLEIYDGTTNPITANTQTFAAVTKGASSWGAAGMSVVLAGGTVATGAYDGSINSLNDPIAFGRSGRGTAYGMMKNAKIYSSQLSDAALQALTA